MGCGTPSTRGTKIELELASRPRSVYTRPCCGPVAQLGERRVRNAEVGGSNPLGSTKAKAHRKRFSGGLLVWLPDATLPLGSHWGANRSSIPTSAIAYHLFPGEHLLSCHNQACNTLWLSGLKALRKQVPKGLSRCPHPGCRSLRPNPCL